MRHASILGTKTTFSLALMTSNKQRLGWQRNFFWFINSCMVKKTAITKNRSCHHILHRESERKRTTSSVHASWKQLPREQSLHQLLRPGNKVVGPVKRSRTLHKRLTHFCHCHSSTENVIHSNGGRMHFNSPLCRSLHGSYFVHLHLHQNMGTYSKKNEADSFQKMGRVSCSSIIMGENSNIDDMS